jgi:alpha-tubulin suppressor-like RCC1 family protein
MVVNPWTFAKVSSSIEPAALAGVRDASAVAAEGLGACAILSGGSVECWGVSFEGSLGNWAAYDSATPLLVPGVSGARSLGAGAANACAVLDDSSVMCWGDNSGGQLGDGTRDRRDTAVHVTAGQ